MLHVKALNTQYFTFMQMIFRQPHFNDSKLYFYLEVMAFRLYVF